MPEAAKEKGEPASSTETKSRHDACKLHWRAYLLDASSSMCDNGQCSKKRLRWHASCSEGHRHIQRQRVTSVEQQTSASACTPAPCSTWMLVMRTKSSFPTPGVRAPGVVSWAPSHSMEPRNGNGGVSSLPLVCKPERAPCLRATWQISTMHCEKLRLLACSNPQGVASTGLCSHTLL